MIHKMINLSKRDLRKALNVRTWIIWLALSGMGVFFFYAAGGKTLLLEEKRVSFISLFLPHMIFGAWAILASYFDIISSDREHNVLDCIITTGISKKYIFISKVLAIMIMSLLLALIYMIPVTIYIIYIGKNIYYLSIIIQYLFPLWGYIMVYASMGTFISVIARSSKLSLIWSLAIGLFLMPRLFVMIVEGVGKIFDWSDSLIDKVSLIAPGVMMQGLSETTDINRFILTLFLFGIFMIGFLLIAYWVFYKQDEFSYGE